MTGLNGVGPDYFLYHIEIIASRIQLVSATGGLIPENS